VQVVEPGLAQSRPAREHLGIEVVSGFYSKGMFESQVFDCVCAPHTRASSLTI